MEDFERRNADLLSLLARSNRKLAMIRAALDGKPKTSVKRNPKLRQQLKAA